MQKNSRSISIDLLRIISMIMVVSLHSMNHGGLIEKSLIPGTPNYFLCNILYALCHVAVNCFVMITGYFQCTSTFKLKKLIGVWGSAVFYSGVMYLILCAASLASFSVTGFIKQLMVLTLDQYWFITAYLFLYMVSPFLNCAIRAMNRKLHLMCCCTLLFLFSFLHNLIYISDFGDVAGGYSFLWFCILYMTAAYFRLYVPDTVKIQKFMLPLYFLFSMCICGERFVAYYITPYLFGGVRLTSLFYSYNSVMCVAATLCLFQFFRGLSLSSPAVHKTVSLFAPLTVAVYLIHDNNGIRMILWELLKPSAYFDRPWLVLYLLLCIVSIFILCCLIEWIRQKITKFTGISARIASVCDRIQMQCSQFFDRITE